MSRRCFRLHAFNSSANVHLIHSLKKKELDGEYECDKDYAYRLPNGACNNLLHPWWGSAFSPYKRLAKPAYDDFVNTPRTKAVQIGQKLPNARVIAANVLAFNPVDSELSIAFSFFGQFASHDLLNTPDDGKECLCGTKDPSCFNIPILAAETNPAFTSQECIPLKRNLDSKIADQCNLGHREQMSRNTHWLDIDQMYGHSEQDLKKIRLGKDGLLKFSMLPNSLFEGLPIDNIKKCKKPGKSFGCFFSGDQRVEQSVMLTSIHTVNKFLISADKMFLGCISYTIWLSYISRTIVFEYVIQIDKNRIFYPIMIAFF